MQSKGAFFLTSLKTNYLSKELFPKLLFYYFRRLCNDQILFFFWSVQKNSILSLICSIYLSSSFYYCTLEHSILLILFIFLLCKVFIDLLYQKQFVLILSLSSFSFVWQKCNLTVDDEMMQFFFQWKLSLRYHNLCNAQKNDLHRKAYLRK